jgi:APA family basic amino acid/polyamine antiporter
MGMVNWADLALNKTNPISYLAGSFAIIGPFIVPIVAGAGFAICLVSANTGVIGVSRVVFSMGRFGLLPRWFSKINAKTRTPVRTILTFGLIGAVMALIGNLDWVADLYNFGALLSYFLVNASLIVLRQTDKDTHRSWEVPLSLKIKRHGRLYRIPLSGIVGICACLSIWSLVMIFHPMGRVLGMTWISVGVLAYVVYRHRLQRSLFSKETGRSIKPMAYKFNALVLIRPEEKEEIVDSIRGSLTTQFRLTLMSVVRTGRWHIPLTMAEQYRELTLLDLEDMARALSGFGFEATARVEVGTLSRVITDAVLSPDYDFVVLPLRKGFKKAHKKDEEDIVTLVSSVAPGKIMVVRR